MSENKNIEIMLITGKVVKLTGKYRPDLEKPNWHYYEDDLGDIIHFRKEHMVVVHEKSGNTGAKIHDPYNSSVEKTISPVVPFFKVIKPIKEESSLEHLWNKLYPVGAFLCIPFFTDTNIYINNPHCFVEVTL